MNVVSTRTYLWRFTVIAIVVGTCPEIIKMSPIIRECERRAQRPETVLAGANRLAGTDPRKILGMTKTMLSRSKVWNNPFGDGRAAERIINQCIKTRSEQTIVCSATTE